MTLSLHLLGINRNALSGALAKYRNTLVIVLATVAAILLSAQLLAPAAAPNLAKPYSAKRVEALADSWAQGNVIALVRHAERCDHSKAPCLGPADGVTERGEVAAQALGKDFKRLGLQNADIVSSLLTRARQTASFMFERPVAAQDWLFNCRGGMLKEALKNKVPGRNLVLVTHSECMEQLEKDMHVPTDTELGYGSSLFIRVEGTAGKPQMIGYLESQDWTRILAQLTANLDRF